MSMQSEKMGSTRMATDNVRDETLVQLTTGIEEFNRGAYYQAHETWEDVWHQSVGRDRDFFKGLIQVDVALFHHRHGNLKGALRLMDSGMALLAPYAPAFMGVDLASLLADCRKALQAMTDGVTVERVTIRLVPMDEER
jgi:predicted metal-dependent hydrolase